LLLVVVVCRPNPIPFAQKEPDYLLWGPLCSSFASSSRPAGCLLQLKHGLDEAARDAKSGCKKKLLALQGLFDPGYFVLAAVKLRIVLRSQAISIPTRVLGRYGFD
jgi:hypothetical protein